MKKRIIFGLIMALAGTALILYSIMLIFDNAGIFQFLKAYMDENVQNLLSVSGIFMAIGMLSLLFSVNLFGWL